MTVKQRIGRLVFPRLPITRALFDELRRESVARMTSALNTVSPARRRRLAALSARTDLLVNVACGPHVLAGFVNLDLVPADPRVIACDCRRSLPLAESTVCGIRVEHFLEHLDPREELPSFLVDCVRILRPGGVLRVVVPDAERYLRAYCSGRHDAFHPLGIPGPLPEDLPLPMDVVNHVFHQWSEHRWAFDFVTLDRRLRAAGFDGIHREEFGRSLLPALAQDREVHAPYSLYVDAVKKA